LVCGFVRKAEFQRRHASTLKDAGSITVNAQAVAFNLCAMTVQRWMSEAAEPDEVALLIAEDNKEARRQMRSMVNFNRNPDFSLLDAAAARHLPLTRIVDTAHFAEKLDSSPLQIADACAFSIMRRLRRAPDCERFYHPLEPHLVMRPNFASLDLIDPAAA
jgi:hypothetical protein